jgi:hypothetical protein
MHYYKAIISKYHGPGAIRGSRYSATDGDGNFTRVQAKDTLNADENHANAVQTLCAKMGWTGTLIPGQLGGASGALVWVWFQSRAGSSATLLIEPAKAGLLTVGGDK